MAQRRRRLRATETKVGVACHQARVAARDERCLEAIGCQAAYPERRASHEFILTFAKQAKDNKVTALDIAKRLLDYNQHAPTIYFPLLVPECFLIEPAETETKEAMDDFIDAMAKILEEANTNPETVTEAPFTQPVRRLDEVKAAKELDLVWSE